jgi:eight-cysteine-cluster-containing protein
MTGGCSGEACINKTLTDKDGSITTCEFDENFPNIQGYTCGCKQNVCGWR